MNTAREVAMVQEECARRLLVPFFQRVEVALCAAVDRFFIHAEYEVPRVNQDAEVWERPSQGGLK